jgi:3-hydroxyacyl-CoA dehydrogenase
MVEHTARPHPVTPRTSPIRRVGVLGAGIMGAGIAAQVADAGLPVLLLDVVPEGAADRDVLALDAVDRILRAPTPATTCERITPANLEDHLPLLAACDWIVEAVTERIDVKQGLYQAVDAVRKEGSVVSSNTSSFTLARLAAGLPARFTQDFLLTHFFNPPRHMRLLELVAGPDTRPEATDAIHRFCEKRLGKVVVRGRDTPGGIANRIGTFWLEVGVRRARDLGLTVEEADAVAGHSSMGFPRIGLFGLLDLLTALNDPGAPVLPMGGPQDSRRLLEEMLRAGRPARGFYRLGRGSRTREAIDFATGAYRPVAAPRLASLEAADRAGLRALVGHDDRGGRFAWGLLSQTLAYAASLVPAVAENARSVDLSLHHGFGWAYGPFELLDRLGPAWFRARCEAEGLHIPPLLREVGEGAFHRPTVPRNDRRGSLGAAPPIVRR